jgi:hypothetical protein
MSNLLETFSNLTGEQKRFVHIYLCENALNVWTTYAAKSGEIAYVESIVGTRQIVDIRLPKDAFESAQNGEDLSKVDDRYAEPITAMHDDDLEFPDQIEFAYYAIYNLFNKYVLHRKIDDWLICNQALSAETDENMWRKLLKQAILKSLEK